LLNSSDGVMGRYTKIIIMEELILNMDFNINM